MADRSFLEWPFFDERHRSLAGELEDWCRVELAQEPGEDVPAAFGGVTEQLDVRSLALIRETLARHSGLADYAFAMQGLGSGTISLFGSDEQKSAYLPAVARGDKIAAFALTEPGSGSDVASMETAAT